MLCYNVLNYYIWLLYAHFCVMCGHGDYGLHENYVYNIYLTYLNSCFNQFNQTKRYKARNFMYTIFHICIIIICSFEFIPPYVRMRARQRTKNGIQHTLHSSKPSARVVLLDSV